MKNQSKPPAKISTGRQEDCRDIAIMLGDSKVVTLCGSSRFKPDFDILNRYLSLRGYAVFSLGVFKHSGDAVAESYTDTLVAVHLRKIDMSDAVVIVNRDGYIGEGTKMEIEHAKSRGKKIVYLHPVPVPEQKFNDIKVGDFVENDAEEVERVFEVKSDSFITRDANGPEYRKSDGRCVCGKCSERVNKVVPKSQVIVMAQIYGTVFKSVLKGCFVMDTLNNDVLTIRMADVSPETATLVEDLTAGEGKPLPEPGYMVCRKCNGTRGFWDRRAHKTAWTDCDRCDGKGFVVADGLQPMVPYYCVRDGDVVEFLANSNGDRLREKAIEVEENGFTVPSLTAIGCFTFDGQFHYHEPIQGMKFCFTVTRIIASPGGEE